MNNHQQADTPIKDTNIKDGKISNVILDKLSICFHDPDSKHVNKTCGLLISDQIDKSPGILVTKNPRYRASCRLRLPFNGEAQETAFFEAGPTRPGAASYRLEFNPSKLSKAGLEDLVVFLNSTIDSDPLEFF